MSLVNTVVTVGDVTLELFGVFVKTKTLSITKIGKSMDAVRRMYEPAVFKRQKAYAIKKRES